MKGWHKESYRHYLAAKGIKTSKYMVSFGTRAKGHKELISELNKKIAK